MGMAFLVCGCTISGTPCKALCLLDRECVCIAMCWFMLQCSSAPESADRWGNKG